MISIKAGLVALSWAGLSAAHLIMKSPVPFGVDTLNSSPLNNAAIGSASSDFPCKQRTGVYKVSQMNNMPVGQAQTLSFTGSASHGGGTCQLAVSLDHEPTTNSTWKIIQVYEGGCPTTGAGNGGTDVFSFKIPDKFPNGQATLAWTWFNRVGNREIYMNCAPITVSGGSDNTDYYNTLPDMYVINLPTSDCSSVESTNQVIPNPGQFVLKGDTSNKLAEATGPGCAAAAAAQTKGVSGYQGPASGGNDTSATSAAAATTANNGMYTPPAVTTTPVQSSAVSIMTGLGSATSATALAQTTATSPEPLSLMITVPALPPAATDTPAQSAVSGVASPIAVSSAITGSASATSPNASPPLAPQNPPAPLPPIVTAKASGSAQPVPLPPVSPSNMPTTLLTTTKAALSAPASQDTTVSSPLAAGTSSTAAVSSPSAAASSGSSSLTTCPQDGVLLCNGPTQFGLCDHGHVVWQAVATGTTCSDGAITKREVDTYQWSRKALLGRWFV